MNPLIASIPPSLIRTIAAKKRPGDIDLGLGEPVLPPDIGSFDAAVEWTRQKGSPYSPNAGFMELREAIAAYVYGPRRSDPRRAVGGEHNGSAPSNLAQNPGPGLGRDDMGGANVCVTIGSEEALYLAIKTVVDPVRHEVLIVEPCYLAYPKLCMLEGIRHRMVALSPADRFRPNADVVLEHIRPDTRLVILNTPSNPTGRIWPEAELRRLAEGLAARGGEAVFVLADEVYREIYHDDAPPFSIAHAYPHTLIAGSLSKSNSLTGLRLGWLAGPTDVIAAAVKVHQFVNTAASTFSQLVALELFNREGELGRYRGAYAEARRHLVAAADRLGLELLPPEGAFYGFIRLPGHAASDSLAFCERLMKNQRVVTVPGRAFGESGEGWMRISWVGDPVTVEEGLRRIRLELDR